jgi:molybdate transport system substrate-binding protein
MKALFILCVLFLNSSLLIAAEVHVAVASNFVAPLEKIANAFAEETGHTLIISSGSTGNLFAQIMNGAGYEVFLSADEEHPKKIAAEKKGSPESIFSYAIGKIVLWSPSSTLIDHKGRFLEKMTFQHLSMANPKLAPYGKASEEVLKKKGLWEKVQKKLVIGENINQAHQFVASGNAELGFVAYSQILTDGKPQGSYWIPPQDFYQPLHQDVILLEKGKNSDAAKSFLTFLKNKKARDIIKSSGYELK